MRRRRGSYEGLQERVRELELPALEVVKNVYADREYEVEMVHEEFTCVCPKTGQPDFATLTIRYVPGRSLVETKSLKLYLNAYRPVGIFHENVVNKVLDDFVAAARPRRVEVVGDFRVRGGIRSVVRAVWPQG